MNSNFNSEEIVVFERYDKRKKKNVSVKFPMVGGRLRLYHEDLDKEKETDIASGIDIDIIKYENDVAVIRAKVCINGNSFTGIGMASKARDSRIFPAILEMAETRAIARALRFAGYGVEYTGAEEMQGVKDFDDKSSDTKKDRDVNDDMKEVTTSKEPSDKPSKTSEAPDTPSLKRQVWELVRGHYPESVKDGVLAAGIKQFLKDTLAKYDGEADDDKVFSLVIEFQDRFFITFDSMIKVEPRKDLKEEYHESREKVVEEKKVDPPPPVVDNSKIKKAEIYRAMPDGINVSALNGSLKYLVEKNSDKDTDYIYGVVLEDIDGFVKVLIDWCKDNDTESGLEPKVNKEEVILTKKAEDENIKESAVKTGQEFRKLWNRLNWENFNNFIIVNSNKFKADKVEYDAAVVKYDNMKVKNEAADYCFPYLFDSADALKKEEPIFPNGADSPPDYLARNILAGDKEAVITTNKSVLTTPPENINELQELSTMKQYIASFPNLSKNVLSHLNIMENIQNPGDAEKFNDTIEQWVTEWQTKNGKTYIEEGGAI